MSEHPHQTCPKCGHKDCFSYNSETGVFKCFSCGITNSTERAGCYDGETFVRNKGITEVDTVEVETYSRPYRGISAKTLENNGGYFTKHNGKETVHWVYPNGTKHRELPKSIKNSGKMDHFFGADQYTGGRNITITEGEEDRLSVIEMMGDWPTVSVPTATPSKIFWENADKYLRNFEKIYLSLDGDDAGQALADKFASMYPGKVYQVTHGKYKDANEFLTEGATKEYKAAWWNAQRIKPSNIRSTKQEFLDLFHDTPDFEYFTTGITGLDTKMLGMHKGAFSVVLAETGIGKTEFFRYLEHRILTSTDYKFAACHGEETELRGVLGLFSYDQGENLISKGQVLEKDKLEDFDAFLDKYSVDERMFQYKIRVEDGVDEIVAQVRYLAVALEVDYIFLEPIQDFVSASTTKDKESLLTDLTNKLKRLAPELNVGIIVIAHQNKEGEAKYCASIAQGAAYEIILKRNADDPDEREAKTTRVYIGRKNRTGMGSGFCGGLLFDVDTFCLVPTEVEDRDIEEF